MVLVPIMHATMVARLTHLTAGRRFFPMAEPSSCMEASLRSAPNLVLCSVLHNLKLATGRRET